MIKKIISIVACLFGILAIWFLTARSIKKEVSYHKNGNLKHEVFLKNGKYDGLWTDYFDNGKVHAKTEWKNGKKKWK